MTPENYAFVLWFTGLPGSGKSTLADKVYEHFLQSGNRVERLDGDSVRSMFPATGFTKEARDEHIKRVGFMASVLEKHDVIVIASFVSPYRETRRFVRDMCRNFIEVYVSTPLEECERRDTKGLYKKARANQIKDFTGISAPYEEPLNSEITVQTEKQTIDESTAAILDYISSIIVLT